MRKRGSGKIRYKHGGRREADDVESRLERRRIARLRAECEANDEPVIHRGSIEVGDTGEPASRSRYAG